MDKSVVNNIWRDINCVETIPIAASDIVKDCKFLLGEVECLESRHKADQKAVEEANAIADRYMKECKRLKAALAEYQKAHIDFEKPILDMMYRVKAVKGNFDTSGLAEKLNNRISMVFSDIQSDAEIPTWESIEKILKDEKLKYLKSYSAKDLVDELKNRDEVGYKHVNEFDTLVAAGNGDLVFVYDRKGD